jgi:hypothetical protein
MNTQVMHRIIGSSNLDGMLLEIRGPNSLSYTRIEEVLPNLAN